jgi:sarcosine oxidase subunit beta
VTPVKNLFVNCGWGTGGFKATPGSAISSRTSSRRVSRTSSLPPPSTLDRFRTGRLIDEAAAAAVAH